MARKKIEDSKTTKTDKKTANTGKKSDRNPKYRYQQVAQRKKLFIAAFIKNNGLVMKTCDEVGICRQTYNDWCQKDPDFMTAISDGIERKLDRLEDKLNSLIDKGDTTATLFAVKCLLKSRGYVEKKEVEVSGGLNVQILNIDPID